MKWRRNILTFVLAIAGNTLFGQGYTSNAYECYKQEDFSCARTWIDSAIVSEERFDAQTWLLRGVIYRNLDSPENPEFRNIAIESFIQSKNIDSTSANKDKVDSYIYKTVVRYYNDAVTYLESNKLSESENAYVVYKGKFKKYIDPSFNFDGTDIEYYNALGSEYLKRLSTLTGEEREKNSARAINAFEMVLAIDPNNYQANFNIGIIYYNDGADLVMNMDPVNTPIEKLAENLERSEILFNNALPKLLKAFEINPSSREAVEGLAGSYYGLNDDDNYMKYQTILDEIKLPGLLEAYQKNPNDVEVLSELVRIYSSTIKNEEEYKKYKEELDKLEE